MNLAFNSTKIKGRWEKNAFETDIGIQLLDGLLRALYFLFSINILLIWHHYFIHLLFLVMCHSIQTT